MARPIVLILLCAFAVQAIRVRETQSRAVFINIPLIPAHLERYLNSSLKPRLYNNSAWITINAYKIDYLETPIGHRTSEVDDGEVWDFVPGLSGYMVKTMAHVTQADGSLPGQMVVDMDFGAGMSQSDPYTGWQYRQGCATSHGVRVESPTAVWVRPTACPAWSYQMVSGSSVATDKLDVNTTDGRVLQAEMTEASGTDPDATLAWFAFETTWKYEQTADRYYTMSNQSNRVFNTPKSLDFTSITSTLAYGRHGWAGEAFGTVCEPVGRCFFSDYVQYIDADPTYVTLRNGSNVYTVRDVRLPTQSPSTVGPTKAPTIS
eukprot:TRINITY_DN4406_c0_g1_i1.p1 TRINITY_DN4406_c0_g1~~TRINITY_DN4406_c0_g1_i1.p1  ORF type:complete len:319 (+),score=63.69 TRINITY_DN4406_c0_g1_i1:229-1185(+)